MQICDEFVRTFCTNVPKLAKLFFSIHTNLHVLVIDHQCKVMNLNQLFSLTILKKRQKTCQTYLVTLVQISHELKKPFCTSLLELLKLVNLIFYVHTQVACTCYGPPMSLHLTGYEPKLIN